MCEVVAGGRGWVRTQGGGGTPHPSSLLTARHTPRAWLQGLRVGGSDG